MNKRFFSVIAAIALLAVSCSRNEVEMINTTDADAISLHASTAATRATITKVDNLESGFSVWATTGSAPTDWYSEIQGETHKLAGTKWTFFPDQIKWPTASSDYPMTFYAYYPIQGYSWIVTDDDDFKLTLEVTVPKPAAEQKDIVSSTATTNVKPATGNLTMTFRHILSKVHFTINNSYGVYSGFDEHVFVQAVGFKHVNSQNVFNVKNQTWGTPGMLTDYIYYGAFFDSPANPGAVVLPPYEFNSLFDPASPKATFYVPTSADMFLMLVPQDPTVWNPTATTPSSPPNGTAYVQLVYRWEKFNQNPPVSLLDKIGYRYASMHPDWKNSVYSDDSSPLYYDGPLYVKVGYPYAATWVEGKGYQYNIVVPGKSGGYLITDKLIDNKGNEIDLKVPGVNVNDPILGDDEFIHLIPTVTDWQNNPVIDVH